MNDSTRHLLRRPLALAVAGALVAAHSATAVAAIDLSQLGSAHPGYRMERADAFAYLGSTGTGAGDVDGDGRADVVVSADAFAGDAFLVLSQPSGTVVDVDSLGGQGASLGDPSYAGYNTRITGAGDFNGDGFADVIFGTAGYSGSYRGPGYGSSSRAVVILGNGAGVVEIQPTGSVASIVTVSGAGDVNGDGLDDVVVGAPYYSSGSAYVVFGKTGTAPVSLATLGGDGAGFVISGTEYGTGSQVSGAGDVNGDGFDDVIVDIYGGSGGAAGIVFGKPSSTPVSLDGLGSSGGSLITGLTLGGKYSVGADRSLLRGAGDVNGDGLGDVIVGSPFGNSQRGEVAVVFGTGGAGVFDVGSLPASQGFRIVGAEAGDSVGYSVAGAGDVNGDGLADVLVSSQDASVEYSGSVYLVFGIDDGTTGLISTDTLDADAGGIRIVSNGFFDDLGSTLASAGDVNGDGLADLLIGASEADVQTGAVYSSGGKAYVVFSAEAPPPAATYRAISGIGDAPPTHVGVIGDGSNASSPDARFLIDFAGGGTSPSMETVTLFRSPPALGSGRAPASVFWQWSSNRTPGWGSATVTLAYTDGELGALPEGELLLYRSGQAAGPWTRVATVVRDSARNRLATTFPEGELGSGAFFAIGAEADIALEDGGGAPLPDGGNLALIAVDVRATASLSLAIANDGSIPLTIGAVTLTPVENVAALSVATAPAALVGPAQETPLELAFELGANGPFSFSVSIENSDPDEAPYDFTVSGTGINGEPEIDVSRGPGMTIDDGGADPLGDRGVGTVALSYVIENQGQGPLSLGAATTSEPVNVGDFRIDPAPGSPVPPGEAVNFDVTFDVLANGPFSFDLSLANNDPDEAPFDFTVSGTGVAGAPEIELARGGDLDDGAMDLIGDQLVGPVALTYTVTNVGQGDLPLGPVTAGGALNVTGFSVASPPPAVLSPAAQGTFTIEFFVVETLPFALDLALENGDADENPYDLFITGDGTDTQVLEPGDLAAADRLGAAVAANGGLFAVGLPGRDGGAGEVIIYRLEGNRLTVDERIPAPPGFTAFGTSLALDDGRLLIGAPAAEGVGGKGGLASLQAALYQRVSGDWRQKFTVSAAPGTSFGNAVALEGETMAIGAPGDGSAGDGAGMVMIFDLDDGDNLVSTRMAMPPNPTAGGGFGSALAMLNGKLAVGEPGGAIGGVVSGSVSVFQNVANNLLNPQVTNGGSSGSGDGFGSSIALSGSTMVVGSPGEDTSLIDGGAAYVFDFGGLNIRPLGRLEPQNPEAGAGFGASVGIVGGGFAVGAPGFDAGAGSVYRFDPAFQELQQLLGAQGQRGFGSALAGFLDGLFVGAPDSRDAAGSATLERDPDLVFRNRFERR